MNPTNSLLAHLRTVALPVEGGTDGELLERFIRQRDEAAFTALVRRHAGMVFGVCRRVLGHAQDAEDAFQATFLVLARKAASIQRKNLLGNWLYGVAHRAALEAKAARRRVKERQVGAMPEREAPQEADAEHELRPLLDRELARLPDKYRVAVVLCDLEGRTRREAAQLVGVPEGTLSGRLTKARRLLARRLVRSGLAPSGAALEAALSRSSAKATPPLLASTVRAAMGVAAGEASGVLVSPRVAALAEGVMKAMLLARLKVSGVILLTLALVAVPASLLARGRPVSQEAAAARGADAPPAAAEKRAESDWAAAEARVMRGTWTRTETVTEARNGVPQPPRQQKVTCVIADGKFIRLGEDGFIDEEMTLRLDPAQKPKAIDLISRRVGTLAGVYQLEGDVLKVCFGADEGQRPTRFPAKSELLWVLQRTSRTPARTAPRFANAEGCFWMVEPTSPSPSMATLGIVWVYEKDRDGAAPHHPGRRAAGPPPPRVSAGPTGRRQEALSSRHAAGRRFQRPLGWYGCRLEPLAHGPEGSAR